MPINRKELIQKLKKLSYEQFYILLNEAELEDEEKWLLRYAIREDRMVINTCCKLHISETKYHKTLSLALVKVYYTIKFLYKNGQL